MKHYIEILLEPDEEIGIYFLWSKLYQQLHLAFVEQLSKQGSVKVGISFPDYNHHTLHLGRRVRLFAQEENSLNQLNLAHWLERLTDYLQIEEPKMIPEKVDGYITFSRYMSKGSPEKLARRAVKRHEINYESALKNYQNRQKEASNAPFINQKSLSNGHSFSITVTRSKIEKEPITSGIFTTYGLSSANTVPWFK